MDRHKLSSKAISNSERITSMKFLKQKNISKFSIRDQTLFANQFGRAVMNLNGGLRLPQGTTAQRPDPAKGRWPGITSTQTGNEYADGTIRYNVDTNSLEALIAGVWEVIRAPGSTAITKQTLGPGDNYETVFGPLITVPTLTSYQASANNIIVLVENVFQIAPGNFTVNQNPTVSVSGTITNTSATLATSLAGSNMVGATVTGTGIPGGTTVLSVDPGVSLTLSNPATADGSYTFTVAYPAGWYLKFTSSVPELGDLGDPIYITVYYGFAN